MQIATKFGIVRGPDGVRVDGRPEHVRGYCEASLRRLGRDVIDLYYLHRVDPDVPVADTVGAMAALVSRGQGPPPRAVRGQPGPAGTGRGGAPDQRGGVRVVAAVARPGGRRGAGRPAAGYRAGALQPARPRPAHRRPRRGTTSTRSDFRRADPRFHGPALDRNLRQVGGAARPGRRRSGSTPGQLALAWLLAQGPDVVPIPGSRRPDRIAENAAAARVRLSPADLERLAGELPRSGWAGDRRSFAVPVTTRGGTG